MAWVLPDCEWPDADALANDWCVLGHGCLVCQWFNGNASVQVSPTLRYYLCERGVGSRQPAATYPVRVIRKRHGRWVLARLTPRVRQQIEAWAMLRTMAGA